MKNIQPYQHDTRSDAEFNALMRRKKFEEYLLVLCRAKTFKRAEKLAAAYTDSEIAEELPLMEKKVEYHCQQFAETPQGKAYLQL